MDYGSWNLIQSGMEDKNKIPRKPRKKKLPKAINPDVEKRMREMIEKIRKTRLYTKKDGKTLRIN